MKSSFERPSSNLSVASRTSATSNTVVQIKSSDGVQRSIKHGIIIYQSDTLHHSEDRVRGYAFHSNQGGGDKEQFLKRYFVIARKTKTLAIHDDSTTEHTLSL